MFPTFISILDIQSWWEVPSIAHFCSLFRAAFNLLDFDIEDLEEALLTDGTEETSWLQELIVRLLSGCLGNNEISTFNYQMFLRRLFRQKCQEHDRFNPFNTDIDFQFLPLRTKVEILQALCDFRLDAEDVLDHLKNLEADSLRVEPLGYDDNQSAYWYFYGTRLYREDFTFKNSKKVKTIWQVICFTEDDWYQLAKKFRKSSSKIERQLYRTLSENFLPELPRLFQEKEILHRKRLLEWLPRRTSTRLDIKRQQIKESVESDPPKTPSPTLKPPSSEHDDDDEEEEEENEPVAVASIESEQNVSDRNSISPRSVHATDTLKSRKKHKAGYEKAARKRHNHSSPAKSPTPPPSNKRKNAVVEMPENRKLRSGGKNTNKKTTTTAPPTTTTTTKKQQSEKSKTPPLVGRQTNNSLASATGQIVIQSVSNPNRKKLKPSQVFRQSVEDLQTGMYKIVEAVKGHEDAWPFVEPVEEEYAPNYYTVIRRPMDLQKMEDKLDAGAYVTFRKFRDDFQLIVDNCRLYNGTDNEYTEMVDNLQQAFQRATDRYLDQISSSDEEVAVEFQESSKDTKPTNTTQNKRKKNDTPVNSTSVKRKPTSLAHTADKRDRSTSVESNPVSNKRNSDIIDQPPEKTKSTDKQQKVGRGKNQTTKTTKNVKNDTTKNVRQNRKNKKAQSPSPSPVRDRSRSRSPKRTNRSPSWPPSSPEHWKSSEKRDTSPSITSQRSSDNEKNLKKGKHKHWKEVFKDKKNSNKHEKNDTKEKQDKQEKEALKKEPPVKHKDKNIKLKETIEKLKAKSELSISDDGVLRPKKEEKISKEKSKQSEKEVIKEKIEKPANKKPVNKNAKQKTKEPPAKTNKKCEYDFDEEETSTKGSSLSDSKKGNNSNKKNVKKAAVKNVADIEALAAATEQTLKDINKWLDDTPRFSEFSSASNSPSHFVGTEEVDPIVGSKIEQDYRKSLKMDKPVQQRPKEGQKDLFKRRTTNKDPSKLHRRREIQRTIERLQPGKSKGNLLSNIQNSNKPEELFPLGPLSKLRESKNSLVVKQDDDGPKLSLGTVLDSFGQQHNFSEEETKSKDLETASVKDEVSSSSTRTKLEQEVKKEEDVAKKDEIIESKPEVVPEKKEFKSENKATPNLSAWFKAFGAPKVQVTQKKKPDIEDEKKENIESTSSSSTSSNQPESTTAKVTEQKPPSEESRKVISPEQPDSPAGSAQPITRQRRGSTGSSISERSSFSQDMDSSPRMSIDERLGAYPAPYPSPLHRSPVSASPVMASPRQEESQRPYTTLNGSIRVGFYQDTVSTKSSPDKSCSPRDQPHSPYQQFSEHVYTPPSTIQGGFSYSNPPYYSQNPPPAYANTNPSPIYGDRTTSSSYYDTTKPLTDQYNAKVPPSGNYTTEESVNSPETEIPQENESQQQQPQSFRQQCPPEKQSAKFPVKKRLYNDSELSNSVVRDDNDVIPLEQESSRDSTTGFSTVSRGLEIGLMTGRQLNINSPQQHSPTIQEIRPASREQQQQQKQFLSSQQQDVRNDSSSPSGYSRPDSRGVVNIPIKPPSYESHNQIEMSSQHQHQDLGIQIPPNQTVASVSMPTAMRPMNYQNPSLNQTNYNLQNDTNYPHTRQETDERKLDMTKLTNIGYLNHPTTNVDLSRTSQYQSLNYNRPPSNPQTVVAAPQNVPSTTEHMNLSMRYPPDSRVMGGMGYQTSRLEIPRSEPQTNVMTSIQNTDYQNRTATSISNRMQQSLSAEITGNNYKQPEMAIPRPTFNSPPPLGMDQSLGLRGNLANLSHIVERYPTDERLLSSLQTSSAYYDKGGLTNMFPKGVPSANPATSSLQIFSQPNLAMSYGREMQQNPTSIAYTRSMTELQNSSMLAQTGKQTQQQSQQQQQQQMQTQVQQQIPQAQVQQIQQPEKKSTKKRKAKQQQQVQSSQQQQQTQQPIVTVQNDVQPQQQGFQSYAGLKNSTVTGEPSAISLKTASVVPGSAFNFGPTPTGLGLPSSLYDKDNYGGFLDEFRPPTNYYLAAAHRTTSDSTTDKTTSAGAPPRSSHSQTSAPPPPGSFPFLGHPQPRAPGYPPGLASPFMSPHQAGPLMDPNSPLYQQYLHSAAGVLHQGLLGSPAGYPPGYHPALSMRQPYDSMTRPPWL